MKNDINIKGNLEIFERKVGTKNWVLVRQQHNVMNNQGWQAMFNTMQGSGAYLNTTFEYFAWSDGATATSETDTAAGFYSDAANSDTKAVTTGGSVSYNSTSHAGVWTCFISSTDNDVASITKFALMNDDPGTIMLAEVKFTALSKDSTKEYYFKYTLTGG